MGLLIGGYKGPNIETGSSGMTERHQEIFESHDPRHQKQGRVRREVWQVLLIGFG